MATNYPYNSDNCIIHRTFSITKDAYTSKFLKTPCNMDTVLMITFFCNKQPYSPSNLNGIVNSPLFYIASITQKQIIDKVVSY